MGEIKLAIRSLLKTKSFTAVAILTLVIGIGATTAVFSVFDAMALRALPFSNPSRLVDLEEWSATELSAGSSVGVSRPMLSDLRTRMKTLQGLAAYTELPVNVGASSASPSGGGLANVPERVSAAEVTGNFFHVLGVPALIGRALDPMDDRAGAAPVVVVSERFFNRRLNADQASIGKTIRINGNPVTVVGVMPRTAVLPEFAQIWMAMGPVAPTGDRSARDIGVIGRLADGASIAQADAEMKKVAADLERTYPEQKNWTGRVRSLRAVVGGDERPQYALMMGAVLVLWAIVCANMAALMLARGVARRREVAVRLALGGSRRSIVWHLLSESLCLATVGGVLGAIAAAWAIDGLLVSLDTAIPSWLAPRVDMTVLGFCIVLSILSAAAFGLLPAIRTARPSVHDDLKAGSQANVGGRSALRGSLVVLQLTLSLVLLAAAGALAVTIQSLANREGNEGADVVQARVAVLGDVPAERIVATIGGFVARLNTLAEARSAAASGSGFIAGFGGQDVRVSVEGIPALPDGVSPRFYLSVTPRYFETTNVRVVEGRAFTPADARGAAPVAIIGSRFARQVWAGRSAIGRRIRLGAADSLPWLTVVGVVSDADSANSRARNLAYLPFAQSPTAEVTLLVAARGDPASLLKPMRDAARDVNPDLPLLDLMTSAEAHARVWRPYRAYALTITSIGAIALLLAVVGLYGVVAYGAEQRTREIGLRIALGARRGDVVRLITWQGMRLIAIGLAFGLAAAALVLPVMKNMMFGIKPFNVAAIGGSAALLVVVGLFASYLPARRAARTSPMVALRSE